ncbi:hypothetical protein [Paenirhodobacter sp.]|uniref:hypothetical protein n=1 Tax=Paenirhodobacter sp. TaxID=1965326 RepID=UPI003B3D9038
MTKAIVSAGFAAVLAFPAVAASVSLESFNPASGAATTGPTVECIGPTCGGAPGSISGDHR